MAEIVAAIREAGLETVAVSLLFSFLNDTHERRLGALLREALPDVAVFLSCDVLPEIREFERASTDSRLRISRAIAGRVSRSDVQRATASLGLAGLHVMGSTAAASSTSPRRCACPPPCVKSGPADGSDRRRAGRAGSSG